MKHREEIIGGCRLILGDTLEVMPQLEGMYNSLITDPVWPNVPADCDIAGNDDPWGLFQQFCIRLPRARLLRQIVIVMRNDSDPRILKFIPEDYGFQQVAWCQYVMPGYLGRVLGGNETAYVFGEPVASQEGRRVVPSVSPKAQPGDRPANGHPCSRALIHQKFLVNWFSDVGETVFDPFMGSATCAEACISLGRNFIGCEIRPDYFDIACRRVEQACRQGDMFIKQPEKMTQGDLI